MSIQDNTRRQNITNQDQEAKNFLDPNIFLNKKKSNEQAGQVQASSSILQYISSSESELSDSKDENFLLTQEQLQDLRAKVYSTNNQQVEHPELKDQLQNMIDQNTPNILAKQNTMSHSENQEESCQASSPNDQLQKGKRKIEDPDWELFKQISRKYLNLTNNKNKAYSEIQFLQELVPQHEVLKKFGFTKFRQFTRSERYRMNAKDIDNEGPLLGKRDHKIANEQTQNIQKQEKFEDIAVDRAEQIWELYSQQAEQRHLEYMQLWFQAKRQKTDYQTELTKCVNFYRDDLKEAYIRNFLNIEQRDKLNEEIKTFSAYQKLEIFLTASKFDTQFRGQIIQVWIQLQKLINYATQYELSKIEPSEYTAVLFNSCFDGIVLKDSKTLTTKMLILLYHQNALRLTFNEDIKSERATLTATAEKSKQAVKQVKYFTDALKSFLRDYLAIPQSVIEKIIANSDILLHEDLLNQIKVINYKEQLVQIILGAHKGTDSPADKVVSCKPGFDKFPWLWDVVSDPKVCKKMSFDEIIDTLETLRLDKRQSAKSYIQQYGFLKLKKSVKIAVQTETILTTTEKTNIEEEAENTAKMLEIEDEYDQMVQYSKFWAQKSAGYFNHQAGNCLVAAKAVSRNTQVVFSQLDPGNGKTGTNFLICEYYWQKNIIAPYVTINDFLKEQAIKFRKRLQADHLIVISQEELPAHFGQNQVFVFDEYFYALMNTQLQFDSLNQLNPITKLGFGEEGVLSTGHRSNETTQFLPRLFGKNKIEIQINESIISLLGQKQEYILNLHAFQSIELARAAAMSKTKELSKFGPIILIGLEFNDRADFNLGPEAYVKCVKDDAELDRAQEKACEYEFGIIGLSLKYHIGVDIRFKKPAIVIVVSQNPPEAETMRQMVGRGARQLGAQIGYLYYQGEKEHLSYEKAKLLDTSGPKFKDAAIILKTLQNLKVNSKNRKAVNMWLQTHIKDFKMNVSEFIASCEPLFKNAVQSSLDRVLQNEAKKPVRKRKDSCEDLD